MALSTPATSRKVMTGTSLLVFFFLALHAGDRTIWDEPNCFAVSFQDLPRANDLRCQVVIRDSERRAGKPAMHRTVQTSAEDRQRQKHTALPQGSLTSTAI